MWHLPLTPDSLSVAVQLRPSTVITGASRSMSMPLTVTVARPPSIAWTDLVMVWSVPLCFSKASPGHPSTSSEPAGLQMNQMRTVERYQPDFDFGNLESTRASRVGSLRVADPLVGR